MRKIYCPHCRKVTTWGRFNNPFREIPGNGGTAILRLFHEAWSVRCGKCGMPWSGLRKRSFPQFGEIEANGTSVDLTS